MKTFNTLSLICLFAPALSYGMNSSEETIKIDQEQALLNKALLSLALGIDDVNDLREAIALIKQGANPYSANNDGVSAHILLNKALKQDFSPQIPLTPTSPNKPRAVCFASFKATRREEWDNKNTENAVKAELKALLTAHSEVKNEQ